MLLSQVILYIAISLAASKISAKQRTLTMTPIPTTLITIPYWKNITTHRVRIGGEVRIDLNSATLVDKLKGGCKKIVMRRHVGNRDRGCSSLKPIRFAKCDGFCLPPWKLSQPFTNWEKVIRKNLYKYRCVPSRYISKKVKIFCSDDGTVIKYNVKVIKNCVCKLYTKTQNENKLSTPGEKYLETNKMENRQTPAADDAQQNR